jgi:hypothetical protein
MFIRGRVGYCVFRLTTRPLVAFIVVSLGYQGHGIFHAHERAPTSVSDNCDIIRPP